MACQRQCREEKVPATAFMQRYSNQGNALREIKKKVGDELNFDKIYLKSLEK